jgi:hypothetical protein
VPVVRLRISVREAVGSLSFAGDESTGAEDVAEDDVVEVATLASPDAGEPHGASVPEAGVPAAFFTLSVRAGAEDGAGEKRAQLVQASDGGTEHAGRRCVP